MVVAGTLAGLVLAELALRLTGFAFAMYPTEVKFGWPAPLSMKDPSWFQSSCRSESTNSPTAMIHALCLGGAEAGGG